MKAYINKSYTIDQLISKQSQEVMLKKLAIVKEALKGRELTKIVKQEGREEYWTADGIAIAFYPPEMDMQHGEGFELNQHKIITEIRYIVY